jgi:hypothetical protein
MAMDFGEAVGGTWISCAHKFGDHAALFLMRQIEAIARLLIMMGVPTKGNNVFIPSPAFFIMQMQ